MTKQKPATARQPTTWERGEWNLFEEWSTALGVTFVEVQRMAGIKPPADGARASDWRAAQGGAPRVRRAVYDALVKLEEMAEEPTEIGQVVMGVDEWLDIGEQLALANRKEFLASLQELRQRLADTLKRPVKGAIPQPAGPRKAARSIGRTNIVTQLPAGDETPGEVAMRKRKQP